MAQWVIEWQAIATFAGAMLASGVAGLVAWRVGKRQTEIMAEQAEIQKRLASIEETKIRIELVEKRAELLDSVALLYGISIIPLTQNTIKTFFDAYLRLDEAESTVKYIFEYGTEALESIPQFIRDSEDFVNSLSRKPFDLKVAQSEMDKLIPSIRKMRDVCRDQLAPQTSLFPITK